MVAVTIAALLLGRQGNVEADVPEVQYLLLACNLHQLLSVCLPVSSFLQPAAAAVAINHFNCHVSARVVGARCIIMRFAQPQNPSEQPKVGSPSGEWNSSTVVNFVD